jgi:hypothetical protein
MPTGLNHRDCFASLAMTPKRLSLRGAERRSNLDVRLEWLARDTFTCHFVATSDQGG